MKIKYIKVNFNDSYQYKYKHYDGCCNDMKEHENLFFLSGNYESFNSEEYGLEIPKMCLYEKEVFDSWGDEIENEYFYPINMCPFCEEKYEYEVIKEVDYSDIYNKVKNKREEYWNKFNKCDSIKNKDKLIKIVRKCDDFLNNMYQIGDFKELSDDDINKLDN